MNITPKDIENPARKSGYDGVIVDHGGGHRDKPFRAEVSYRGGRASGTARGWRGPRRATALEAAQDRCDYINTGGVATPATLRSAGHSGRRRTRVIDEEERAALGVLRDKRAMRSRQVKQGYVYCITDGTAVKIGYSLKPEARVAELQTGNPRPLRLLATQKGTEADEKALHVRYLHLNVLQEWFRPTNKLLSEFGLTKKVLCDD
jgi:hypothetical protein